MSFHLTSRWILRSFLVWVTLMLVHLGYGQEIIKGKIVDQQTNLIIPGVALQIIDTSTGTSTDEKGEFTLKVTQFPIQLLIAHLGYENRTLNLDSLPEVPLIIKLKPATNILEEVVITANNAPVRLSSTGQYSLVDFEIMEDKIVWIEHYGTFKKERLTLADFDGKPIHSLALQGLKTSEGFFKSCTESVYLLTPNKAYRLQLEDDQLKLARGIAIDTLNRFVKPCQLKTPNAFFYIVNRFNDQLKTIIEYKLEQAKEVVLAVVGDQTAIENYQQDLGLIREGQRASSAVTNDPKENKRIRQLQRESDFLLEVFYKPNFPIHIFEQADTICLFNHPEKQLMFFKHQQLVRTEELGYVEDKKWLKHLVQDADSEIIYGLFDHAKGVALKKILPAKEGPELVAIIEQPMNELTRIQVFDNQLWYLRQNPDVSSPTLELVKQRF